VQQFSDVGDSDDARHYRDFTVIPGPDPRLQQAGRLEESGCGGSERPDGQFSFRPERVLFRPGEAVPMYASATPRFPCQDEKSLLSESETASVSPGGFRMDTSIGVMTAI